MPKSVEATIATALAETQKPVSASVLRSKLAAKGKRVTQRIVDDGIRRLIDEGRAFEHPPARAGSLLPTYSTLSPIDFVAARILSHLKKSGRASWHQTRTKLPKPYHIHYDRAMKMLFKRGDIIEFEHSGRKYVCLPKPEIRQLLTRAQITSLKKNLNVLRNTGREHVTWEGFLEFIDQPPSRPIPPTEADLRLWHNADLPPGGDLPVPLPLTYSRYETWCNEGGGHPDLAAFHNLLRTLSKAGRVALTHHNAPGRLPESERRVLMEEKDGRVIYYYEFL